MTQQTNQPTLNNETEVQVAPTNAQESSMEEKASFDPTIIRNYPRSNRKVTLEVSSYNLATADGENLAVQSMHISPFGIEFQSNKPFPEGALLRINVSIPDYWTRKQRFVEYRRIDAPGTFRILGKVVLSQDLGKRGKKKLVTVQTVNIDDIDEQVLKSYLQEG